MHTLRDADAIPPYLWNSPWKVNAWLEDHTIVSVIVDNAVEAIVALCYLSSGLPGLQDHATAYEAERMSFKLEADAGGITEMFFR